MNLLRRRKGKATSDRGDRLGSLSSTSYKDLDFFLLCLLLLS
jgi:hypothetical protein